MAGMKVWYDREGDVLEVTFEDAPAAMEEIADDVFERWQSRQPLRYESNRVLARHDGFTDAELDFIIHYDIKVRMGRDAESDGDEGEE